MLVHSRFPCCVLLAASWNTNENPSTDKLSRAINYFSPQHQKVTIVTYSHYIQIRIVYVLFPFFSYQRICPTFSKLDPMKCERRAGGCGSSKLMKMTLFSGSFPNGWHFCKLPHCQPHKLTTEGRGEGIDLAPFRSPPPQQIKTKEF